MTNYLSRNERRKNYKDELSGKKKRNKCYKNMQMRWLWSSIVIRKPLFAPNNRLHADAAGAALDLGVFFTAFPCPPLSRSTIPPAAQVKRSVGRVSFHRLS
ncbi:hypothetical protein SE17_26470 [Kouleothrix aurantiaca]|uniref:Uncharacterized protein n=1 Tax=Kouleothrix aurantiaca TaxID=186479 RepID=A0A0P9CY93_9CHLR|nr:hypothetical protein SE17_26470 [Kouleothrix aurantiaca]